MEVWPAWAAGLVALCVAAVAVCTHIGNLGCALSAPSCAGFTVGASAGVCVAGGRRCGGTRVVMREAESLWGGDFALLCVWYRWGLFLG